MDNKENCLVIHTPVPRHIYVLFVVRQTSLMAAKHILVKWLNHTNVICQIFKHITEHGFEISGNEFNHYRHRSIFKDIYSFSIQWFLWNLFSHILLSQTAKHKTSLNHAASKHVIFSDVPTMPGQLVAEKLRY